MAITNFGYDGQISAVQFAGIMQHQGLVVPVVGGKDDLAVAANNAATLTCTVAAGESFAPGVRTVSDAVVSVTFDAVVTTGATRWDAVVLRRSWSSGGSSTITVVKGTASAGAAAVLPAGVDLVLDAGLDQVLALVQLTYGSTIPTAVIDRRAWAHPVYTFPSSTSLPPAAANLYGMEALVGTDRYRCLTDSGGTPAWVRSSPTPVTASGVVVLTGTGATGVVSNVAFPAGLFATAPAVSLTRRGSAGVTGKAIPYVGTTVSTSGFVCAAALGDGAVIPSGTQITVGWLAVL